MVRGCCFQVRSGTPSWMGSRWVRFAGLEPSCGRAVCGFGGPVKRGAQAVERVIVGPSAEYSRRKVMWLRANLLVPTFCAQMRGAFHYLHPPLGRVRSDCVVAEQAATTILARYDTLCPRAPSEVRLPRGAYACSIIGGKRKSPVGMGTADGEAGARRVVAATTAVLKLPLRAARC